MSYHFFSDHEFAGPGPMDLITFWNRTPRQLRQKPRTTIAQYHFPNSSEFGIPEKALVADALEIATLWNSYYTGPDWKFLCSYKDVERWMNDGFILILRETVNKRKVIVATFVCHILPDGVYCGAHISQAGLLDGLVIIPRLRKKGLASYMLVAMDKEVYTMPSMSQSILVWFREHSNSVNSFSQIPIAVLDYVYIKIEDIPTQSIVATVADPIIVKQAVNSIFEISKHDFTILSPNSADPDIYWFQVNSSIVGIADTHRVSNNGYMLWEVIFAANLQKPNFENLQNMIEISALSLPSKKGIIFASNSKSRGNLTIVNKPWTSGTSGCLSMHVYNWMPPSFLTGDILFSHTYI